MGVWLDEEFPEHPKIEALDDDLARWLYVAGLCYANRNLTGGRIPKGAALRLTDKATPKLVAKLLVAIPAHGPCWEDHGDHYRIHNYEIRQQSAEKRRAEKDEKKAKASQHARRAAEARWRASNEHASGMNRASPEHQSGIDWAPPRAMPEHRDSLAGPGALPAPGPTPFTPLSTSSSNHNGVAAVEKSEEEETPIQEACRLVAERRFRARPAGEIRNPTSWKASVAADVLKDTQWAPMIRARLTAEAMCEVIEPTPIVPGCEVPFVPLPPLTDDEREASRRARAALKAEAAAKLQTASEANAS